MENKELVKVEEKDIEIFKHEQFGKVRTFVVDGITRFVGKEIADKLEYKIPRKAIRTHCKGCSIMELPSNGGQQKKLTITQGDVIRLIARSKMPKAKEFESWIFDEVIPTIIKTGGYINDVNAFMDNYLDELDEEQSKIVLKGITKKVDKLKRQAIIDKQKIEEQKGKIYNLEEDKVVLQNQNDQLVNHNDKLHDKLDNRYHCSTSLIELISLKEVAIKVSNKLGIKLTRNKLIEILIKENLIKDYGVRRLKAEIRTLNNFFFTEDLYLYNSKIEEVIKLVENNLIVYN
jgi:prophage antirepressor-like protein